MQPGAETMKEETIQYEPITRSQLQEMEGKTIEKVSIFDASRSILFILKDRKGEKSAYGFKFSEWLDDVIISRSV